MFKSRDFYLPEFVFYESRKGVWLELLTNIPITQVFYFRCAKTRPHRMMGRRTLTAIPSWVIGSVVRALLHSMHMIQKQPKGERF